MVGVLTALVGVTADRSDDDARFGAALSTTLVMFLLVLALGAVQGWRGNSLADCLPVAGGVTAVLVVTVLVRSVQGDASPLLPLAVLLLVGACACLLHAVGMIVGRTVRPGNPGGHRA